MLRVRWALAALCFLSVPAAAQQQQVPQQVPTWAQMPRMQLERQFAGPLQDTIIQRWRDPVDGMICYIYLPITASHSQPTQSGFVQYGPNTIGSISCVTPGAAPAPAPAAAPAPARRPPQPPPRPASPPQQQ